MGSRERQAIGTEMEEQHPHSPLSDNNTGGPAAEQQPPQHPSPSQQQDGEPSLAAAIDLQLAALEAQAGAALAGVATRVDAAWVQTLEHCLLLEAGVAELQAAAAESVERTNELLAAAMRLNAELRGIDLVASRVAGVRQAVERLEAQVKAVVVGG
eukprot:scaffold3.g6401.t1